MATEVRSDDDDDHVDGGGGSGVCGGAGDIEEDYDADFFFINCREENPFKSTLTLSKSDYSKRG